MAVHGDTAPPGLLRTTESRLSGSTAALDKTAPPSYYECDPQAQDLSMRIFNKLDANSSGYLESPYELHCALEVMLGMYSALAKPVAGRTVGKNCGHLQLADILSSMLKQFDFEDGRMDFFEWDVFARSVYEVAGRQRYWSIASLWAERLAHEAPHAKLHKGNLMRNPGPEKPRLAVPRPRLLPQENRSCAADAEVPENLPQLPPARGRFHMTNTKSGTPRETALATSAIASLIDQPVTVPGIPVSFSPIHDIGVDGALPPSNGSPPTTACSSRPNTAAVLEMRRALGELGVSPPRRRRRVLPRKVQEIAGSGAGDSPTLSASSSRHRSLFRVGSGADDSPILSASSSRHRSLFSEESPKSARSVTIPGKRARPVVRPATTPCQRDARMTVDKCDWSSTWPPECNGSGSGGRFVDPPSPRKTRLREPWPALPEGLADSSPRWQHRLQAEIAEDLLKRDCGMMVAMHKLRKPERIIRHALLQQESQKKIAVHSPKEEQGSKEDAVEEVGKGFAEAIRRIQAAVRGKQARQHAKVLAHRTSAPQRRSMLLEALKAGVKKKKGNKSGTASPRPEGRSGNASPRPDDDKQRTNVAAGPGGGVDPALLQVQLNMVQFLKQTAKVRKVKHTREGHQARRELPLITVDELWDIITGIDGNISTHLEVREMLDIFHHCKLTGLDLMMAKFLPQETFEFADHHAEPEDLSPGEVSHLCMMMINQPEFEMTESRVRQELDLVKEECRDMEYRDVVNAVPRGQYLNLVLFRRLIHYMSMLMQIEQAYLMSHIYWQTTGHFEMTDTLAAMMIKHCARKTVPRRAAPDLGFGHAVGGSMARSTCTDTEDDHHHDAEAEDMMLLLDERFSGQDFSRMCHACLIVDPRDKVGLSFGKITALFSAVVRFMERTLNDRVKNRPKLQKNWNSRKQEAANADVNALNNADVMITGRHEIHHEVHHEDVPPPVLEDICELSEEGKSPTIDEECLRSPSPHGAAPLSPRAPSPLQGWFNEKLSPKKKPPSSPNTKHRPTTAKRRASAVGSHSMTSVPRMQSRPSIARGGGGGIAEYLNGRTEFSVLIQETYKAMPHDIFNSPLQMCVEFLQTGSKGH